MIQAKIVADSINPLGKRLTTFELTYPLSIHGEIMTHRVFSRNAASSRAIPFETFRKAVIENPALPVRWGSHQKGMQSGPDLPANMAEIVTNHSLYLLFVASSTASGMHKNGCHKSIVNRLLAPWAHITTLVTAHNFQNFFALRAHADAEPNFQVLAYKMLKQYLNNVPISVQWGDWHLPYSDTDHDPSRPIEEKKKIAVARACWVSYNKPGKMITSYTDAFDRHDAARDSGHWSPFEHVAQAVPGWYKRSNFDEDSDINLCGWKQYRKEFLEENKKADLQEILDNVPEWIKPHIA